MKYTNYNDMKDFYTIDEVCRLFEIDKAKLRRYAEKYNISPQEDQYGNWGFRKVLVRKLHNHIYKEQRNKSHKAEGSPWGRKPYKPTYSPWDNNPGSSPWDNNPSSSPWGNQSERKSGPWA